MTYSAPAATPNPSPVEPGDAAIIEAIATNFPTLSTTAKTQLLGYSKQIALKRDKTAVAVVEDLKESYYWVEDNMAASLLATVIPATISTLQGEIVNLKTSLATLTSTVTALTATVTANNNDLDARLDPIETANVATIKTNLTTVTTALATLTTTVTAADAALDTRLDTLETAASDSFSISVYQRASRGIDVILDDLRWRIAANGNASLQISTSDLAGLSIDWVGENSANGNQGGGGTLTLDQTPKYLQNWLDFTTAGQAQTIRVLNKKTNRSYLVTMIIQDYFIDNFFFITRN